MIRYSEGKIAGLCKVGLRIVVWGDRAVVCLVSGFAFLVVLSRVWDELMSRPFLCGSFGARSRH